jgi:hypothetical protein
MFFKNKMKKVHAGATAGCSDPRAAAGFYLGFASMLGRRRFGPGSTSLSSDLLLLFSTFRSSRSCSCRRLVIAAG